jgi:hypothetical protein
MAIIEIPDPQLPEWLKILNTYDPTHYIPGKKVTAEEWNTLFLASVNQGNYLAETVDLLVKEYLPETFVAKIDFENYSNNISKTISQLQNTDTVLQNNINVVKDTADTALLNSQIAKANSEAAVETANNAVTHAQQAEDTAYLAKTTAENALTMSTGAQATAGKADEHSRAAETIAEEAKLISGNAKEIAEGIDAKASSALDLATTFKSVAESAKQTAQQAIVISSTALTNSQTALENSREAMKDSSEAQSDAASALVYAQEALSKINQNIERTGTSVIIADTPVSTITFNSDPQTQISAKVSQSDFDKLVNNETIINANSVGSIFVGATPTAAEHSVVIGKDASVKSGNHRAISIGEGSVSKGGGVAIGLYADVEDSFGIAIGTGGASFDGMRAKVTGDDAIQFGAGTNSKSKTLQLYNDNIYNWNTHTLTVQNIELNGENIEAVFDAKYLPTSGGTLTGGLSVNGDLTIVGNITQQGEAYETHAEQVYSTKDYIYLREGNTGGLAEGAYTGFEFIKYDGTSNGRLVVDNKGIAKVGDVGDEQPLATREETPISNGFAKWDSATSKFITDTDVAKDSELKSNYLPLTAGSDKKLTGNLYLTKETIVSNHIQIKGLDTSGNAKGLIGLSNTNNLWINYDHSGRTIVGGAAITPFTTYHHVTDLGIETAAFRNIRGKTIYQNGKQVANAEDLSAVTNATLSDDSKTLTVMKRDGTSFDFQGGGGGGADLSGYLPLSGGTMSGPLVLTGGDAATGVGNMQLDVDGQITAKGTTSTLFGRSNNGKSLLLGHSTHNLSIRGTSIETMASLLTRAVTPVSNANYNLGSSEKNWKEIYGTTIYQNGNQVANKSDIPTFTLDGTTLIITL